MADETLNHVEISQLAMVAIKGWGMHRPAPICMHLAPTQSLRSIELACEVEWALRALLPHAEVRVTRDTPMTLRATRSWRKPEVSA